MNDNTLQDKIKYLITNYKEKIEEKKRLNKNLSNDYLEGIILTYENVVRDLIKL